MQRTVKFYKVNYLENNGGEISQKNYISTETNETEIKRELKRVYGKNTFFVSFETYKVVTYELDDKIFFDNAKIIKETTEE